LKTHIRLLVPLALILAACGSGGSTAATVNGVDIPTTDIEALVPSAGSVDAATFRTALQNKVISLAVLDAANTEFGIAPTEEEIQKQYEDFKTQISQGAGGDYETGLSNNNLTDARVMQGAEEQLVADALRVKLKDQATPVTDADVQAEFDTNADQYRQACVKHILVATEDEAKTVKARLDAGEDFATVAQEVSTDTGSGANGGDLGCAGLGQYVQEFIDGVKNATVGVVTDPVQSQFGWHLILVDSIDDDATVKAAIKTQLETTAEQTAFSDWVLKVLKAADVTVNAKYGTWTTDPSPAILAPESSSSTTAPGASTTTAPASDSTAGE
jgi:parvulin-like peptidyl-prolyl isomerase